MVIILSSALSSTRRSWSRSTGPPPGEAWPLGWIEGIDPSHTGMPGCDQEPAPARRGPQGVKQTASTSIASWVRALTVAPTPGLSQADASEGLKELVRFFRTHTRPATPFRPPRSGPNPPTPERNQRINSRVAFLRVSLDTFENQSQAYYESDLPYRRPLPIYLDRGQKQGDQLSPLLFGLIFNALLFALKATVIGHRTITILRIPSLGFADDLTLVAS